MLNVKATLGRVWGGGCVRRDVMIVWDGRGWMLYVIGLGTCGGG